MKALHLKTAILATAICAVGYLGCQKDNSSLQNTVQTETELQKGETTEDTDAIKAKIENFSATLDRLKNGENADYNLTADETVWNIEALLNMKHTWGDIPYSESELLTLKIPIKKGQTTFSSEEIVKLYNASYEQLLNHLNMLEGKEMRKLVLVDIDIKNIDREGTFFTVTSVFATSDKDIAKSNDRSLPDIRALAAGSSCPTNEYGALKLQNQINANKPVLASGFTFAVAVDEIPISSNGFDNQGNGIAGTQRRQSKLYYSRSRNSDCTATSGYFTCYPADDHNWYYTNWWTFINANKPSNKTLKHMFIVGETNPSYCQGPSTPVHLIGNDSKHSGLARYAQVIPDTEACCPLGQ